MPYELRVSKEATADIQALSAFHRNSIVAALELLTHQATIETRNRKPLSEPLGEFPAGTWEARIGDYRAFYGIEDEQAVRVFRVIFKGKSTTLDALGRGK